VGGWSWGSEVSEDGEQMDGWLEWVGSCASAMFEAMCVCVFVCGGGRGVVPWTPPA
jgi:hypothetical protein